MAKFTLRTKLFGAFMLVTLLLTLAGGYLAYSLHAVAQTTQQHLVKLHKASLDASAIAVASGKKASALRGYVLNRNPDLTAAFKRADQQAQTSTAALLTFASGSDKEGAAQIQSLNTALNKAAADIFQLVDAGNTVGATIRLVNEVDPEISSLFQMTGDLNQRYEDQTSAMTQSVATLAARAQMIGEAGFGLMIVAALVLAGLLARSISNPLARIAEAARRVATGDLTVEALPVRGQDEVAGLASAINTMVQSLRSLVQDVMGSTVQISSAATDLNTLSVQAVQGTHEAMAAVNRVATGTSEQARSAEEVSTTVSELEQTIGQIAAGAGQSAVDVTSASEQLDQMVRKMAHATNAATSVATTAQQAANSARSGRTVVDQTIAAISRIRAIVGSGATATQKLASLSAQVEEITALISEIAGQTNLLALNAAIEAARAGEHGRGFAVVAEEVRRLADRCASSAQQIGQLIGEIQHRTTEVVGAMTIGSQEVEAGDQLSLQAGQALQEIERLVGQAATEVATIATATQQVQADTTRVVQAFNSVASITEENTAATEEMAAGAGHVQQAVKRVAEVAQANAGAAEDVSSTVSGLAQAAEEVSAAANGLSDVAAKLQSQVLQFHI